MVTINNKDLYAIFGHPVMHSKSPWLYHKAFLQYGINGKYIKIDAKFPKEILLLARELGLKGFNITSPLKTEIIPYLDHIDETAKEINAVNTVKVTGDNKLKGYNTDYLGVILSLSDIELKEKRFLILGMGGAGRAAAYGLSLMGIKNVNIVNRTRYNSIFNYKVSGLKELKDIIKDTDIIINCLPPGIFPIKKEYLRKNIIILDANYYDTAGKKENLGVYTISGLKWLYYQFEKSFEILLGYPVKEDIYNDLLKTEKKQRKAIALTGFMGSGKTTIGRRLREIIDYGLYDTDEIIEKTMKTSIPEIFCHKNGEKRFREIERETIKKLDFSGKNIFSLGGGALSDSYNRQIIKDNCITILLYASFDSVYNRIKGSDRPIYNMHKEKQDLRQLYYKRLSDYLDTADLVILNEGSIKDITERLSRQL